jgi:hypothetical protein
MELPSGERIAWHYIIGASAARVRDAFETKKNLKSQVIMLRVPSPGSTLEHRRLYCARRRQEIKDGVGKPVTKQTQPRKTLITRLGVDYRPRAIVRHGGDVDMSVVGA